MGWLTIYNNTLGAISQQMQSLNRLQEEVSTGSKVNRASDDPVAASQILSLNASSATYATYVHNIGSVDTDMSQVSSALSSVDDALVQVKQLMTQASSETYSPSQVAAIGNQVNSLLEGCVSSANTKLMGRCLFSGDGSSKEPYAVQRDSGGYITSVQYTGSDGTCPVAVGPGVEESGMMVGSKVFSCDSRGTPIFMGNTGLANTSGTGTSSVEGDAWITVLHGTTTYVGATGVAAGASSASLDTIVGNNHTLHIDVTSGTVSLDDGETVSYSGASTNLKLTNAAGDVAYVDMSGLDGSLTGAMTVAVHSSATMTIDDGQSSTAATFGEQTLTDSRTGKILYVNSSALVRTGSEPVRVPGTYDLFESLINARDLLLGRRNVASSQWESTITNATNSVSEVYDAIVSQASSVGARQQAMDTLKTSITNIQNATTDQTSTLQDADVTELTVDLAKIQNFYQMTLSSAAKIMNLSLLDYLK